MKTLRTRSSKLHMHRESNDGSGCLVISWLPFYCQSAKSRSSLFRTRGYSLSRAFARQFYTRPVFLNCPPVPLTSLCMRQVSRITLQGSNVGAIFELGTGLETLNLHMCNGTGDWALISSLPHLKTLRIRDSRLSATVFEELLLLAPVYTPSSMR